MQPSDDRTEAVLSLRAKIFTGHPEYLEGLDTSGDAERTAAAASTVDASHAVYTLWNHARDRGVQPPPEIADSVLGVVAELGRGGGWALFVGYSDGAASMYTSSGGGVIGGEGHASVRGAAAGFCAAAGQCLAEIPPGETPSPGPGDGMVRFTLLTPGGLRVVVTPDIGPDDIDRPLYPLFGAMHKLITALRTIDEGSGEDDRRGEGNDESSYLNCLLTTLAKNMAAKAHLDSADTLPDPVELAVADDEIEWIRSHEFDLAGLDAQVIIGQLVEMTSFGVIRKARGKIEVALATSGGGRESVVFGVQRGKGPRGATSLVVGRVQ